MNIYGVYFKVYDENNEKWIKGIYCFLEAIDDSAVLKWLIDDKKISLKNNGENIIEWTYAGQRMIEKARGFKRLKVEHGCISGPERVLWVLLKENPLPLEVENNIEWSWILLCKDITGIMDSIRKNGLFRRAIKQSRRRHS